MDSSYRQDVYKKLVQEIEKHINSKTNLLVLNLPGMGATHFLQAYIQKNKDINYIDSPQKELSGVNILNLHFNNRREAPNIAQNYFNQANKYQKFILSLNLPYLIEDKDFLSKYSFLRDFYSHFYLPLFSYHDSKIMLDDINPKLTDEQKKEIHYQGQGIARLVKFFGVHYPEKYQTSELDLVIRPLIDVLERCSPELGSKFGIKVSDILKFSYKSAIKIDVNFDLSFSEDGRLNPERLTKEEAAVLDFMMKNEGQITKEQISNIKWGNDSYDKFSDQAINQCMRRLRLKLRIYKIETIPNVGYKITR